MNLFNVDLNLLLVLDALLDERHVSRAGSRVGLSQPATSAALGRLRRLFSDELLVREGNRMFLTPKAVGLREPLAQAIAALTSVFAADGPFDPAAARGVFRLAASDYVLMLLLPALGALLEAQQVDIAIDAHPLGRLQTRLDDDDLDLVVGTFDSLPSRFRRQTLFEEHLSCLIRNSHPILSRSQSDSLTLDQYLSLSHLRVSPRHDDLGTVARALSDQNLERRVACVVPDFLAAPFVVEATDLVATVPDRIAQRYSAILGLTVLRLPLELQPSIVEMVWHERKDGLPLDRWLRGQIAGLAGELTGAHGGGK